MDGRIQQRGCETVGAQRGTCRYCGSPLNPTFYFCLHCATPYKPIEAVVKPVSPRKPTESELIKQKVPQVWTVFWTYASVVFVALIIGSFMPDSDTGYASYLILATALIGATTLVLGMIYSKSLAVQFSRTGFGSRYAWLGLGLLVPTLALNLGWHEMIRALDDIWLPPSLGEMGLGTLPMLLFICIAPAITEEIGFRGLVQHWLHATLRPWRAILLASALFAALHLTIVSVPYLFLVGILLGWTRYKTGSLYPCMLIHFLHNAAVIFVFPLIAPGW